jgi:hypothetical protein
MHDFFHLSSRASELAEALYVLGRLDDAEYWAAVAEQHTAPDDLSARFLSRSVRAKIAARRGAIDDAEKLAREAVQMSELSDGLNRRAKLQLDLAEVLRIADRSREAADAAGNALLLYEAKGNHVGAKRVRALLQPVHA